MSCEPREAGPNEFSSALCILQPCDAAPHGEWLTTSASFHDNLFQCLKQHAISPTWLVASRFQLPSCWYRKSVRNVRKGTKSAGVGEVVSASQPYLQHSTRDYLLAYFFTACLCIPAEAKPYAWFASNRRIVRVMVYRMRQFHRTLHNFWRHGNRQT